jgi:hypothetical protein
VLTDAAFGLRVRGLGFRFRPLEDELQRRDVGSELHQVLLGGGARHLGGGRATAQRNEKGEEEAEPLPRPKRSRR